MGTLYTNELSNEFKSFLEKSNHKIEIRFCLKNKVEEDVNSIDFIYTDKKNFVVSKLLRIEQPVFNIFKGSTSIDEHEVNYHKIRNNSIDYNAFINEKSTIENNIMHSNLNILVGEWYHYVYGSEIKDNGDVKFWNDKVVIYENGSVDYFSEDVKMGKGEIVHKKYQSIMIFCNLVNERLFSITFDNIPYKRQEAFVSKVISKQYRKNFEMMSFGIFSRNPIESSKVKEILGEVESVRLLESSTIEDKLTDYIIDTYGYYGASPTNLTT